MFWTLALMLWQVATPLPPKQYNFRSAPFTRHWTRPAVAPLYVPGNGFVKGESPVGKCSIPLVNAPGFQIVPDMPTVNRGRAVDPKMVSAPLAPPCENWFSK